MSVTGADVTDYAFKNDGVSNLGNGANINGDIVNQLGRFDGGVELGTAGMSTDDIQTTSFILDHDTIDLTLDLLELQDFGIRITSVGEDGSTRAEHPPMIG